MPRKANSAQTTKSQNTKAQTASNAQKTDDEVSYDIITTDAWNVKQHNCGLAKPNKSGQGKSAPFTYNKKRFFLKVPKMYCPFGASKPKPKPGEKEPENPAWSLQMSFSDDVSCQAFQTKVDEFDEYLIDQAIQPEYQVSWLGASKTKPFSREVVDSKYTRMLKYVKKDGEINNEYPPFIRAQFPTTFKAPYEFTCEIYDKNNEIMEVSTNPNDDDCISKIITGGCFCSALLSGSIWANATGFGVTWRIAQLKVFPSRGLPKGKCLVDDPEDDDSEEETEEESEEETPAQNTGSNQSTKPAEEVVEDEGEEIEEVIEEDDEQPPSSPPVQTPPSVKVATAVAPSIKAKKPLIKK